MINTRNNLYDIVYNVAVYIRLSKEDEKDGESESVANQRTLLTNYVNDNGYNLYDVYIDDGYTGTNFNRPDFKRMIKDIELGKVNMVITKDLSRLGRDYIGTGEYVEKYFPMHNVRYISLLDGVDTYLDSSNNEIAPFKAIINDMYSRDNSKKIRASLKTMQKDGKWVGGCTPFGYMQDPNDKNHLVINENEAWIIKKIFDLAGKGITPYAIKDILHNEKIPTSAMLRNRVVSNNTEAQKGLWSVKTVKGILQNELYTGDLVQNRRKRISYKVRKIVNNPRSEWIIVPNTHEALVERSEFERIQKLITSNQTRSKKKVVRILDGLLYCHECKHRISINAPRTNNKTYIVCNYYRMYSKLKLCTSHQFNYDILENQIIETTREVINRYINKDSLLNNISSKAKKLNTKDTITINVAKIQKDLELKNNNLDKMYMDKLEGTIDDAMYSRLSEKLKGEIKILEDKIKFSLKQLDEFETTDESKKCEEVINEFIEAKNYTRELMLKLINRVEIHDDKSVDIYFNFKGLNFLIS